jgi:serine/threonine protein kinase
MTVNTRATTVAMSRASRAARGKALLLPQQVITSPETRLQYRIDSLLGQGGFGQAYLAKRMTRSLAVPSVVAIKASEHIDGWLREAYFGQRLAGHARAIRVFDAFPLVREDGSLLYCSSATSASCGTRATGGASIRAR